MLGPFKLNAVPLRRVHQQYVIATSTRLDISNVKVPATLNDAYFRRDKKALRENRERQKGNIFASNASGYSVNNTRKKDQVWKLRSDYNLLNLGMFLNSLKLNVFIFVLFSERGWQADFDRGEEQPWKEVTL